MLAEFVTAHRDIIIESSLKRAAVRETPKQVGAKLANGIPLFLDQLCEALRLAESAGAIDHRQINASATENGRDLLGIGLSIEQVIHCYGDVCQTVSGLAVKEHEGIDADEFKTLNLCLDDATAAAVTEYSRIRDLAIADRGTERLSIAAHELSNLLTTAMLSFDIIKSGQVAVGGSTGEVLSRSLTGLRALVDRSLIETRTPPRPTAVAKPSAGAK